MVEAAAETVIDLPAGSWSRNPGRGADRFRQMGFPRASVLVERSVNP
jgi:hypothetical protein